MRRKTEEELRAANRQRQARWREKNRWVGQQRKLACYGKSLAQKLTPAGVGGLMEPERKVVSGIEWDDGLPFDDRVLVSEPEGDVAVMAQHAARMERFKKQAPAKKEAAEVVAHRGTAAQRVERFGKLKAAHGIKL